MMKRHGVLGVAVVFALLSVMTASGCALFTKRKTQPSAPVSRAAPAIPAVSSDSIYCKELPQRLPGYLRALGRPATQAPQGSSLSDTQKPKWSTLPVKKLAIDPVPGSTPFQPIPVYGGVHLDGEEIAGDVSCSKISERSFVLSDELTLQVTVGNRYRHCSDAPRILGTELENGQPFDEPLFPVHGWNIESMWCTGNYVVFGVTRLETEGKPLEAIAFWNLKSHQIRYFRIPSLSKKYEGWREASLKQTDEGLIFKLPGEGAPIYRFHPAGLKWGAVKTIQPKPKASAQPKAKAKKPSGKSVIGGRR